MIDVSSEMWIALAAASLLMLGAMILRGARRQVLSLQEALRHRFDLGAEEVGMHVDPSRSTGTISGAHVRLWHDVLDPPWSSLVTLAYVCFFLGELWPLLGAVLWCGVALYYRSRDYWVHMSAWQDPPELNITLGSPGFPTGDRLFDARVRVEGEPLVVFSLLDRSTRKLLAEHLLRGGHVEDGHVRHLWRGVSAEVAANQIEHAVQLVPMLSRPVGVEQVVAHVLDEDEMLSVRLHAMAWLRHTEPEVSASLRNTLLQPFQGESLTSLAARRGVVGFAALVELGLHGTLADVAGIAVAAEDMEGVLAEAASSALASIRGRLGSAEAGQLSATDAVGPGALTACVAGGEVSVARRAPARH